MRAARFALSLLLVAGFGLTAAAAPAQSFCSAPAGSDEAFVAALAREAAGLPEPIVVPQEPSFPELGTPEAKPLTCNASNDCGDGNVAYCEGNSICQVTFAGVKCDGVETQCPHFCSIAMNCDCCNGPYTAFCWSKKGDCQYTGGGIACNGHEFTCEQACPLCPEW